MPVPALISAFGGLAAAGLTAAANSHAQAQTNALNESMQREQWERDDTAYQRMVQDMQAAGLNPLSSFSSPVSSGLTAQAQAPTFDFSSAANNLMQLVTFQKQYDLQNKALNLKALTAGVSPDDLDDLGDTDILDAYQKIVQSNATNAGKAAASDSHQFSSPYGKLLNDAKTELPVVKDVIASINDSTKPLKKGVKELTEFLKSPTVYGLKKLAAASGNAAAFVKYLKNKPNNVSLVDYIKAYFAGGDDE